MFPRYKQQFKDVHQNNRTMKTLSIIITSFNSARWIVQLTETIVELSKRHTVIVVDDGSTDGTRSKLENLKQNVHFYLYSTTGNRGVSAARNLGINAANTDYVTFLDHDDLIAPEKLEYCLGVLSDESDETFLAFSYKTLYIQSNRVKTSTLKVRRNDMDIDTFLSYLEGFSDRAESRGMYHACLSAWGKIFSLKTINDKRIRFEERINKFEDCLFGLQYINTCSIIKVCNEGFYVYNQVKVASQKGLSNLFCHEDWLRSISIVEQQLANSGLTQYPLVKQFVSIFIVGTIVRTLTTSSFSDIYKLPMFLKCIDSYKLYLNSHIRPPGASRLITYLVCKHKWLLAWILIRPKMNLSSPGKAPFWCVS